MCATGWGEGWHREKGFAAIGIVVVVVVVITIVYRPILRDPFAVRTQACIVPCIVHT